MELTVLVDNNCRLEYNLLAEPAMSFLLENEYHKVLFDCGQSDIFIKNAYKMGLDLSDVTDIVLSHGHVDHTGGLLRLEVLYKKMLLAGISLNHKVITGTSDVFEPKLDKKQENIGFPGKIKELSDIFDIHYADEPQWLAPRLVFLGKIPKTHPTEYKYNDDSALVFKSDKGLCIITGCCHVGIQNLIEYAKKITGEERIDTFIGGLHLIDKSEYKVREIGIYLRGLGIKNFYPCHCCDLTAKIILSEYLKVKDVYSGLKISCE